MNNASEDQNAKRVCATNGQRATPRSVMRIVHILEDLSARPTGASLATLSESIGAPKSSLLNLLRGLLDNNYVRFANGTYQLGPESFSMARAIVAMQGSSDFAETVRPIMRRLVAATKETALLAEMSNDRRSAIYVEKIESPTAIRFPATIGSARPLLWSAVGRVLLAFQSENWLNSYLEAARMVKYTPDSEVRREHLRKILEEVRQTLVTASINQGTRGISGFAAPLFDNSGKLVAAIGVAAPIDLTTYRRDELSSIVCNAGLEASRLMGYRMKECPARR